MMTDIKLHSKYERIKNHLSDGFNIREIALLLHVSSATVQAVRSSLPELFSPRLQPKPPKPVRLPSVVVFSRIAQDIYQGFKAEMEKLGLDRSGMLRFILNERYPASADDRLNRYELQGDCDCPSGSIIRNVNSNLDGDRFVCDRCARVRDIIGG